jgi:hypothetical protein
MAKQISLTYSVLDSVYQNATIQEVLSLLDASASPAANVGTIDNPFGTGFPLLPTDPDPKMFSFYYKGGIRFLVSKVVTPVSGIAPYTTWSLVDVSPYGTWSVLAKDIILRYPDKNGSPVATNAYGVAPVGDWLYIADYDARKTYQLGANELNGLPEGTFHTLNNAPLDLGALPSSAPPLPPTAKGQAIIALTDTQPSSSTTYLYELFTDFTVTSTTPVVTTHNPGHLVRMGIDTASGTLNYQAQCETAKNPQELIPIVKTDGSVHLLIPAAGGEQQVAATNEKDSMIQSVLPFGAVLTPTDLVTGDLAGAGTFDIFAIAAPDRKGDDQLAYILTHDYAADYSTDWTLYKILFADLLALNGRTLSQAVAANKLVSVDSGTGTPGYFWNIFVETGATADNDRLWFFRGSALLATPALAYAPPPQAGVTNRYFATGTAVGQIGGQNVDWVDFTAETVRQAGLGKSLKHSVRAATPPAAATAAEEGEEK